MDLILAVCSLPVTIPLIALLCAISAAKFRCQPLFFQERRGVDEERFSVIKIRSLPRDFPEHLGKHHLEEQSFGRWTRFLRKSHLDELPQIYNIIRGSMSLIGPRPMIDPVVEHLEPEDRRKRSSVKPGLTGAWQISTAGTLALHAHPELDNEYVDRATFKSDVWIAWATMLTILSRRNLDAEIVSERAFRFG